MNFSELDEATKDQLREMHRYDRVMDGEWWDATYEDTIQVGALLGLTFEAKGMQFSGFSSQGDGASFSGTYAFEPQAVEKVKEYAPKDTELHKIAQDLTDLHNANPVVMGPGGCTATITQSGRYCHSGTMSVSAVNGHGDDLPGEIESRLQSIIRNFADWHYKQLEKEHDYLTSNESIDEMLADRDYVRLQPGQEALPPVRPTRGIRL